MRVKVLENKYLELNFCILVVRLLFLFLENDSWMVMDLELLSIVLWVV